MEQQWIAWAQRLQALAQNGLTYNTNPFEIERNHAIQQVAREMLAAVAGMEPGAVPDLFAGEVGHATPKVDARGVVFQDETILLVLERADGLWTLPGGWVDVGEPPSRAVEREVFEESGYQTRAVKLLALYDRNHARHAHPPSPFHIYKLFFRCTLEGGAPTLSIETSGVDFFRLDALPPLSLGRVTPAQIARFFDHARHPEWPTDFD